jgi:hypothetical protein
MASMICPRFYDMALMMTFADSLEDDVADSGPSPLRARPAPLRDAFAAPRAVLRLLAGMAR